MTHLILFGLSGVLLAFAQLFSLRTLVRRYVAGRGRAGTIFLHVARLGFVACAWVAVGRIGGARGLLAAFSGFLIVRPLLLRRMKGALS